MVPTQVSLPQDKHPVSDEVNNLTAILQKIKLSAEELGTWYASISNYAFWAKRFEHDHDPSKIIGQDNLLRYRPHKGICFRIQENDTPLNILRVLAAAMSCGTKMEVSWTKGHTHIAVREQLRPLQHHFRFVEESEDQFNQRVKKGAFRRVRLITGPSEALKAAAAESGIYLAYAQVLANGRFELLHYLREIAFSIDYHRYGNLGVREGETRKPVM